MNKKSMKKILVDDEELNEYIKSLEEDIDSTTDVDDTINLMLENIMKRINNFDDIRAIKKSLIESVTGLLELKSKNSHDRIKSKKEIFNILKTKKELELKEKQNTETNNILENTSNVLLSIMNRLDSNNIYPEKKSDKELLSKYNNIIDIEPVEVKEENKEQTNNNVSVLEIQKKLG